jgi:hypothetical protein
MLLIVGLVNWKGSGSNCGLIEVLSMYMSGKPEKIHKITSLIQPVHKTTPRRHIPYENLSCAILGAVVMNI